jgi:hypothetical protein
MPPTMTRREIDSWLMDMRTYSFEQITRSIADLVDDLD